MGPRSAANRLFLKNLADSGKIDANVFAFSIGKDNEKSSVTIGGYWEEGNAVTPIMWHDLANT